MTLPEYLISGPQSATSLSVARYVELKGLPAGKYVLTANVADRLAGKTAESRTSFMIEWSRTGGLTATEEVRTDKLSAWVPISGGVESAAVE